MYTVENTAEVAPPQAGMQQLITREDGPKESQVDTFTLLKVALRSDQIISLWVKSGVKKAR